MGQNMPIKVLVPEIVFKIAACEAMDRMFKKLAKEGSLEHLLQAWWERMLPPNQWREGKSSLPRWEGIRGRGNRSRSW